MFSVVETVLQTSKLRSQTYTHKNSSYALTPAKTMILSVPAIIFETY